MFSNARHLLGSVVCGLLLCSAFGCADKTTRHPVEVSLGQQFSKDKPRIEVVITAMNDEEGKRFAASAMSQFFSPNNSDRLSLDRVELHFGSDQPATQGFSPASKDWDQHWKAWEARQATQLFVMAFLPGHFDDKPGNLDARRQMVPLWSKRWEKENQTIKFELTPANLVLLTPPKPGK